MAAVAAQGSPSSPFGPPGPGIDWALFLDVDGTLLDIAARPDLVVVPAGLVAVLRDTAQALGGALALVSGRTIAELDSLFHPLRMPVAGQHGAEIRRVAGGIATAETGASAALRRAVVAAMRDLPGTLVEDKGRTVAVHFRADPAASDAIALALTELIRRSGEAVEVIAGKSVWEVRPLGADKGHAVAVLMAEPAFQGRHPVFVGDDITDADGFDMVERLGGIALPVGTGHGARRPVFSDAVAVRRWLASFVASLEGPR